MGFSGSSLPEYEALNFYLFDPCQESFGADTARHIEKSPLQCFPSASLLLAFNSL